MAGSGEYGSLAARVSAANAAMRAEEQSLASLSVGVAETKRIAGAVSDEVSAQSALLDDLEAGVGRAKDAAANATARTEALERDPYNFRSFCALLWPIVLLLLVVAFWIKHLLFG